MVALKKLPDFRALNDLQLPFYHLSLQPETLLELAEMPSKFSPHILQLPDDFGNFLLL